MSNRFFVGSLLALVLSLAAPACAEPPPQQPYRLVLFCQDAKHDIELRTDGVSVLRCDERGALIPQAADYVHDQGLTLESALTPRQASMLALALETHNTTATKRSRTAKCQFLRQQGYKNCRVPKNMIVDHIRPLACGGADTPSNMQLQTREAAKAKDKVERKGC